MGKRYRDTTFAAPQLTRYPSWDEPPKRMRARVYPQSGVVFAESVIRPNEWHLWRYHLAPSEHIPDRMFQRRRKPAITSLVKPCGL